MKRLLHRLVQSVKGYGTGYARANQLGLRALGLVYFVAFASYLVQADGLVGANGVLPFADWLRAIQPQVAEVGYWRIPTLLWLWPSDTALHVCLWAGLALAVALMAGLAPVPATAGLWALYLSVVVAGRTFWGFQWDNLLLEAGLLAVLASPWRWRMRWRAPDDPPRLVVFLFHWLVFRLMFLSGYVKLASRDAAWWDLTALTYHYWTQPLPVWTAWYANLLPVWVQKFSCFVMFGIELGLPFFIWLGGRARAFAAAAFVFLMLLIAATGNYTFFNLLTALLCIWLVRDAWWNAVAVHLGRWKTRSSAFAEATADSPPASGGVSSSGAPHPGPLPVGEGVGMLPLLGERGGVRAESSGAEGVDGKLSMGVPVWTRLTREWVWAPGLVIVGVSAVFFLGSLRVRVPWPGWVGGAVDRVAPFRSVNSYGLFAVMTKTRPEIVLEGTWDGERWFAYEFRWKPGDPGERPRWVAPHQPRLDWQMWFAALGTREGNPWLINLMVRLLQNEPDVLALLLYNPFEQQPPVQVRAVRYDYRFTTRAERAATGAWWAREYKDLYCPPFRLNPNAP
ncbi:MAG TPA: lipase maturation factor family protein [Kiritimatiellia bacterium]|nr:lipase maturation factor family protein [Kiritimatiellia bacterium]